MSTKCPKCQFDIEDNFNFCPNCGRAVIQRNSDNGKRVGSTLERGIPTENVNPTTAGVQKVEINEEKEEIKIILRKDIDMVFRKIPNGTFIMGSVAMKDYPLVEDEAPQSRIEVDDFWMGKYPVTNLQYYLFTEATGHRMPGSWLNGHIPVGKENHPVVKVSWHDALAFCQWLSDLTGEKIKIPNEPQWEKAARGQDDRIWPWGDHEPTRKLCNCAGFIEDTTKVGLFSPLGDSPYGICDMAGNVWEWTMSLKFPYPYKKIDGRESTEEGGARVLRGGSFGSNFGQVRLAYRFRNFVDNAAMGIGFRCIRVK